MRTSQEAQISTNRQYRKKKFLIFKGNRYPVDFISLLNNSNYFCEKMSEYHNTDEIKLQDESIDITSDSFEIFLDFCHDEINDDKINEQNIFQLQRLAKTYSVSNLIKSNERFFANHPDLSLQLALYNETTNEESERVISSHFCDFINNPQLISLPVQVLYRILNNYDLNINQLNENDQQIVIDFLLKYLKKNGKKSSILFSNIDIGQSNFDLITTLLNEFSDEFNFDMIKSKP